MNKKAKILIIEDDPVIIEFLSIGLKYEGYEIFVSDSGNQGLKLLKENNFNMTILDIMLPDTDGFNVCRQIRSFNSYIPILMLTVKKEVTDRIKGLDSGADDYLTKPFNFEELLARIRALLRRSGHISENKLIISGNITMNTETLEVKQSGKHINLTPTEFGMLELFMRHPRKVFTRETLLNRVLGYDYDGGTNIIDVHVSHLRKKMDDNKAQIIRTIHRVGYTYYPIEL